MGRAAHAGGNRAAAAAAAAPCQLRRCSQTCGAQSLQAGRRATWVLLCLAIFLRRCWLRIQQLWDGLQCIGRVGGRAYAVAAAEQCKGRAREPSSTQRHRARALARGCTPAHRSAPESPRLAVHGLLTRGRLSSRCEPPGGPLLSRKAPEVVATSSAVACSQPAATGGPLTMRDARAAIILPGYVLRAAEGIPCRSLAIYCRVRSRSVSGPSPKAGQGRYV